MFDPHASATCHRPPPRRPFAEKYAADQAAFFADYAKAHKKLSELGAGWEEGGPVSIAAELASVGAKA